MAQTSKPRKIVPKSRFRVEIDGIGNVHLTTAGALKIAFNMITTDEGGAATTAQSTVNTYKYDPFPISRPLSEDMTLAQWAEDQKNGIDKKPNGFVYAQDAAGKDLYRWSLEEIQMVDYQEFEGDSKGGTTESMMESCTLYYRERGIRELLQ
jgi:phage tail-like protein